MSESKAKSAKVGTSVDVTEGGTVVRPDGSTSTVSGGSYFLDVPGVFVVEGQETTVK